jgi:hypothetical protein
MAKAKIKLFLWYLGIPLDWLALFVRRMFVNWQLFRTHYWIEHREAGPIIEDFDFKLDQQGYEATAVIKKYPEVYDLGLKMMLYMNEYPEAANFVSMTSMAPDGKFYTLSVKHNKSVPEHELIAELKNELAALKEQILNG